MPVAAAAPELAVVLLVALMLVVLIVLAQLYSNGRQARSFTVGLPVIADPTTAALDFILQLLVAAGRNVDSAISTFLVFSVQGFGRLVVLAFNAASSTVLFLIHDTAAKASSGYALAVQAESVDLPALSARVGALASTEAADIASVKAFTLNAINAAALGILARLVADEGVIASQQRVIDTYRPLWDQLAAVPGGVVGALNTQAAAIAVLSARVGVLERALGVEETGVSALERTIAGQAETLKRLAGVGVIAAAGDIVVAELVRIAENPCGVCPGVNLNDLEGRVASLELAGF